VGLKYELKEIAKAALWRWAGDDYYVLSYPPKRKRTIATDFVLDFKNDDQEAVAIATALIRMAITNMEPVLKKNQCKYMVSIPPCTAGKSNIPCERVCKALGQYFDWIQHLPGALQRTRSVCKSAYAAPGNRPTYDDHRSSIAYTSVVQEQAASFIMFDDVITKGTISRACRDILIQKTRCKRVIGVFLGRTE
jgi:predicted amidophosphoribosyltransferase